MESIRVPTGNINGIEITDNSVNNLLVAPEDINFKNQGTGPKSEGAETTLIGHVARFDLYEFDYFLNELEMYGVPQFNF